MRSLAACLEGVCTDGALAGTLAGNSTPRSLTAAFVAMARARSAHLLQSPLSTAGRGRTALVASLTMGAINRSSRESLVVT